MADLTSLQNWRSRSDRKATRQSCFNPTRSCTALLKLVIKVLLLCNCHVLAFTSIDISYAFQVLSLTMRILRQLQPRKLKLCGRCTVALKTGSRAAIPQPCFDPTRSCTAPLELATLLVHYILSLRWSGSLGGVLSNLIEDLGRQDRVPHTNWCSM